MAVTLIGLGRMGGGMVRRLTAASVDVVGVDLDSGARAEAQASGARVTEHLAEIPQLASGPRVVWIMLKSGDVTRAVIAELGACLSPGDLVVDGGNSDFRDAADNAHALAQRGIEFADVGVSGGQWGYQDGYGLMVGASDATYRQLEPVLSALGAGGRGQHVGGIGAGHLVKAIHNGVQYAILQAYAEGHALLAAHQDVDVLAAMEAWQNGSSVRSYLLKQVIAALTENPNLEDVVSQVPDSGMGRWTAEEAIRLAVPTPLLTMALHARFASRSEPTANRLLVAARDQIGGKA